MTNFKKYFSSLQKDKDQDPDPSFSEIDTKIHHFYYSKQK
jgi:hypothetical protein